MAGPSVSESKAEDSRIAATDQAQVLRGNKSTLTESGAIAVTGKDAQYRESGSIDFSKAKDVNIGGLNIGNLGAGASVTLGDGGDTAAAFADASKTMAAQNAALLQSAFGTVQTVSEQNSQALQEALGSQGSSISSALSKLGSLAESQQTGGVSGLSNTFKWLLVAGLVGFGLLIWKAFK